MATINQIKAKYTEYKKRLKPFLNQISNNSNFTPEIAR